MECRQLKQLQRQAISYQHLINVRRYWFLHPEVPLDVLDDHVDMYMLANSVVSAEATLLAWYDIIGMTDTRKEESELLAALKSRIIDTDGQMGWSPKSGIDGTANYYVTGVRGIEELAESCPTYGDSIVASVLPKLEYATEDMPRVRREMGKDYKGHFMILKSAVHHPSCTTAMQDRILDFLIDVIANPAYAAEDGRRDWYPETKANGDETGNIVFSKRILDAILGGVMISSGGSPPPWQNVFRKVTQHDRTTAMEMFAAAELFEFRGDTALSDRQATVARPTEGPLPGVTRRASIGGMYDQLTALSTSAGYQAFYDADADAEPSPEMVSSWLEELSANDASLPKQTPSERPHVTSFTLPVCLVVKQSVHCLQAAVHRHKCLSCNLRPPNDTSEHDRAQLAMHTLIDALFAISGEANVGDMLYCGFCSTGIRWIEVGEWKAGKVRVTNPGRQIIADAALMTGSTISANEGAAHMSSGEYDRDVLPPDKDTVVFSTGDELYAHLVRSARLQNVPFCHPGDDLMPRTDDDDDDL